jgi:hypothetical protein|tara:strand:- start:3376 stop:3669 length:294 start_codon:yes stop_codon:yes gene_type:complete
MIHKLKIFANKDVFVIGLLVYCSGWFLLYLYWIAESFFNAGGEYTPRMVGMDQPANLIKEIMEQSALLGILIFPLVALAALVNIKMTLNRMEEKLSL